MTVLTEIREPPRLRVERDDAARAARASLRSQIGRLERRLGALTMDLWESRQLEPLAPRASSPRARARLLTLGELEAVRDDLVGRIAAGERLIRDYADSQAQARARLEEMLADPSSHRFETVRRAALGEPSCGAYRVVPRLGLLGMLFGWWCVKLSSGCPLPMPYPHRYYSRKPRSEWGRNAKIELAVTIVVVVVVIAAILIFLLVYHDFPFRTGEPT